MSIDKEERPGAHRWPGHRWPGSWSAPGKPGPLGAPRGLRAAGLLLCTGLVAGLTFAAAAAAPKLLVSDAWVRGTVEGQTGSGAYMRLTSREDAHLTSASAAIASKVEIHEMRMVNKLMTMRPVEDLALPANTTVSLEHQYHVMLIGLRQTLQPGQTVDLTLHLVDAKGGRFDVRVAAPVRALNAPIEHE